MVRLVRELRGGGVATWFEETATDGDGRPRKSWLTRERYYAALLSCLGSGSPASPGRRAERDEVVAVAGERSPSTLYLLVSDRAKGGLRERAEQEFAVAERAQAAGRRWDVVDNLAVETKVWSFRDHREGWLRGWRRPSTTTADSRRRHWCGCWPPGRSATGPSPRTSITCRR
ncbi:hypothetical protein ACRYCC_39770 [Actinomadura scrupuli]|uniref:hypothetical protein n=1 Tax=Actinomadura scrupuli TaxID=559629 RepID=UPI003D96712B